MLPGIFSVLSVGLGILFWILKRRASQAGDPASWSLVLTTLGVVFVAFAAWHCCLNRRALLTYVRAARREPRPPPSHPQRD